MGDDPGVGGQVGDAHRTPHRMVEGVAHRAAGVAPRPPQPGSRWSLKVQLWILDCRGRTSRRRCRSPRFCSLDRERRWAPSASRHRPRVPSGGARVRRRRGRFASRNPCGGKSASSPLILEVQNSRSYVTPSPERSVARVGHESSSSRSATPAAKHCLKPTGVRNCQRKVVRSRQFHRRRGPGEDERPLRTHDRSLALRQPERRPRTIARVPTWEAPAGGGHAQRVLRRQRASRSGIEGE
jgi:hypothetical protein